MNTPNIFQQLRDLDTALVNPQAAILLLKRTLEVLPDPVVIVDEAGLIALVNSRAESFFGYPRSELEDHPVERLIPEALREVHARHRHGFNLDPSLRPMGARLDLQARHKTGRTLPVEINLGPVVTPDGTFTIATIRLKHVETPPDGRA